MTTLVNHLNNCTNYISRTVAVTPFRSGGFDFAEVKRVCQDCTLAGFKAIHEAGPARPFRFLYFSAEGTPQDPSQRPYFLGDYQVMRVSFRLPYQVLLHG
jgi:hypothetical protein